MIVAVGSWRGTGATTTALLLASCLATRSQTATWLIEADPAGGVLAGRIEVPRDLVGGLERVAFPTERVAPVEALNLVAYQREHLRIVTAPSEPFRAHACHQPRLPWHTALRDLGGWVVVDVGRLRSGTAAWPILSLADTLLLAATPEVSAAVASYEWMQAAGRVSPTDPGLATPVARYVIVDAPGGIAFTRQQLSAELDGELAAWLPWEPAAVDLIHRGATSTDRRLRRSELITTVNVLAAELAGDLVAA